MPTSGFWDAMSHYEKKSYSSTCFDKYTDIFADKESGRVKAYIQKIHSGRWYCSELLELCAQKPIEVNALGLDRLETFGVRCCRATIALLRFTYKNVVHQPNVKAYYDSCWCIRMLEDLTSGLLQRSYIGFCVIKIVVVYQLDVLHFYYNGLSFAFGR